MFLMGFVRGLIDPIMPPTVQMNLMLIVVVFACTKQKQFIIAFAFEGYFITKIIQFSIVALFHGKILGFSWKLALKFNANANYKADLTTDVFVFKFKFLYK